MSISSVEKEFISFISKLKSEINKDKINVGILYSGGVDSTVLLYVANKYKDKLNLDITILHVVFDDFKDYEVIKTRAELFAKYFNNNLIINYCSLKDLNSRIKENARKAIKNIALESNCDIALSGHHANDQIETFLFRVFSRSSLEGLKGMEPLTTYRNNDKSILLGKPFLNIFKKDLYKYAYDNSLDFFEDETNLIDSISERNYIRNSIIPLVENRFRLNNILDVINLIKENIDLHKESLNNIDIYKGEWDINGFINLSLENRVFVIREYFSKVFGYNLNKGKINELKNKLAKDLTNLYITIGNGFVVEYKDKKIVCGTVKSPLF